jgi:hypothetical protein
MRHKQTEQSGSRGEDCFDLCQVCQQPRRDFRPIYYAQAHLFVYTQHFRKFVTSIKDAEIPTPRRLTVIDPCKSPQRLNYLPIVDFQMRNPTWNIDVCRGTSSDHTWTIMKRVKTTNWEDLIRTKVIVHVRPWSEIVSPGNWKKGVRIAFHRERVHDWMCSSTTKA